MKKLVYTYLVSWCWQAALPDGSYALPRFEDTVAETDTRLDSGDKLDNIRSMLDPHCPCRGSKITFINVTKLSAVWVDKPDKP